jgi:hypothetical protein
MVCVCWYVGLLVCSFQPWVAAAVRASDTRVMACTCPGSHKRSKRSCMPKPNNSQQVWVMDCKATTHAHFADCVSAIAVPTKCEILSCFTNLQFWIHRAFPRR